MNHAHMTNKGWEFAGEHRADRDDHSVLGTTLDLPATALLHDQIMPPRVMTRSVGRLAAESRGWGMGGRAGRAGGRGRG
ncbi:hypothetical protein Tco_1281267, partial [Tanacetum coccineum]